MSTSRFQVRVIRTNVSLIQILMKCMVGPPNLRNKGYLRISENSRRSQVDFNH